VLKIIDLTAVRDWSRLAGQVGALADGTQVLVGVSDRGLPAAAGAVLARLTATMAPDGPGRGWVRPADDLDAEISAMQATVRHSPSASLTLDGVLRATADAGLSVVDAVRVESFAYSMLLGSSEFAAWRAGSPRRPVRSPPDPVLMNRIGDTLHITLNDPDTHNALSVAMRDGLRAGLFVAERDTSIVRVVMDGAGPSFCSGGHLDEFGTAADMAVAHHVRLARHVGLAIHRLAVPTRAELHGHCAGSGVEIPAFADEVRAAPDATFWLPELHYGLIPGAGGTVSIARRIGRWRTAYLGLTGRRLRVPAAVEWGLIDGLL
jgi:hypothetical protein